MSLHALPSTDPKLVSVTGNASRLTLAGFQNRHRGESIVVCGCGESLRGFQPPPGVVSIGVNDVGRQFTPDYLVVVNPPGQFRTDRFKYVQSSTARFIFTQLELRLRRPNVVRFQLGRRGGTDSSDPNVLHYTQNSPYVAVSLAAHLGATRIGLLGVDFTDGHFFGGKGPHPLSRQLQRIDTEYGALRRALASRGVELINLSPMSRLTTLPHLSLPEFLAPPGSASVPTVAANPPEIPSKPPRVFFVNYRFLACGDVFATGLAHAAKELGLQHAAAWWDDPGLARKIRAFSPDLVFVVHGRRCAQRWPAILREWKSAVWLLDEPYEVDNTTRWSSLFGSVFVNDPATLARHPNAHYLPTCYDSHIHFDPGGSRPHRVGFIGGYNPVRERFLMRLVEEGLLSYVVGGPWKSPVLRKLCLAENCSPAETARLYQGTQIVLNVFRSTHHFNRQQVPAISLNPRIYEALACGALVVSEPRSELGSVFPEVPVADHPTAFAEQIKRLLKDDQEYQQRRESCLRRLTSHTYQDRLVRVMNTCLPNPTSPPLAANPITVNAPVVVCSPECDLPGWRKSGHAAALEQGNLIRLSKPTDDAPGSEEGLSSCGEFAEVELAFEVFLRPDTRFIAKLHHLNPASHLANSYHLYIQAGSTHLARHNRVLKEMKLGVDRWLSIQMRRERGTLSVVVDGHEACRVRDRELPHGYAFVGVKGGEALVRHLRVSALSPGSSLPDSPPRRSYDLRFIRNDATPPRVSIVTTVYDRVECLRQCLRSVGRLTFQDIEQIIVSDNPVEGTVEAIEQVAKSSPHSRLRYANLAKRANDWGISPATVGLALATGQYVAFLSDDNGYTQDHFDPLVSMLDNEPGLGFVYSSCRYDGRRVLNQCPPAPGRIDLGQPLFRRDLFQTHFAGGLPFRVAAWDWQMIQHFLHRGVRYRHVDRPSFIFRLAKYPEQAHV